ncbi:MAG: ABC transporter permease [Phycisphaerales bacterium]
MFLIRFLGQTVGLAAGQISANKGRATLTMLGIIIGVGSVIAVVAALQGMKGFVLKQFETVGISYMNIDGRIPEKLRGKVAWQKYELTIEEVRQLGKECPHIQTISPHWRFNKAVRYGQKELQSVRGLGIWPTWHVVENRSVLRGRQFTSIDEEGKRNVCLINEKAIEELDMPLDPVGEHVFIGGRRFLVVGVVEQKEMGPIFGAGEAMTEVYVPFSTAQKMRADGWINSASALAVSADKAEEAKAEALWVLRKMRGIQPGEEDTFEVFVVQAFVEQFNKVAGAITMVAGAIVSVSLLVGGVGIMNIMLVSVSERTREIGLRKAVGAKPLVILTQFLVEAVVLCTFGGLIGIAVGQALTMALRSMPGGNLERAAAPGWAIVLALCFSAGVGVIFGMFPAIKASRLDPIEALRHE